MDREEMTRQIKAEAERIAAAYQLGNIAEVGDVIALASDPDTGEPIMGTITEIDGAHVTIAARMPAEMAESFIEHGGDTEPRSATS